jgi:hypothetical protein
MLKKRYVIFDDDDLDQRGTCVYNGHEYQAEWKGLVTKSEHALMVVQFAAKSRPWGSNTGSGRAYLLTGLIYCAECGKLMQGGGRVNRQGRFERRYICKKFGSGGVDTGRCGHTYRIADPVDTLVTEAVLARFDSPEVARALAEEDSDTGQLDELIGEITRVKRHRQNLVLEYGRGEHKKDDYTVMLQAADDAIDHAQDQLAKYQSTMASKLLPRRNAVSEVWSGATLDWKRAVISLLVDRIIIHRCPPPIFKTWRQWKFDIDSVEVIWRH